MPCATLRVIANMQVIVITVLLVLAVISLVLCILNFIKFLYLFIKIRYSLEDSNLSEFDKRKSVWMTLFLSDSAGIDGELVGKFRRSMYLFFLYLVLGISSSYFLESL